MFYADITSVDWDEVIKSNAKSDALSKLKEFIDMAVRSKFENRAWREAEGQADMNIAWYEGRQDVFLDEGGSFSTVTVPYCDDEARLVYNEIEPNVNATVAIYGQQIIDMTLVPATDDSSDQDQAELKTSVLQYYWDWLDVPRILSESDFWAEQTGIGAIKVCWNPDKGPEMGIQPEDVGLDESAFKANYGAIKSIYLGDVDVEPISLFNLYWEPYDLPSPQGCEYCIEVYDRSRAYVASRFPELDMDELGEGTGDQQLWRPRLDTGRDTEHRKSHVRVVVLWVPPRSPLVSRGAHIVMVGDQFAARSEFPYEHGRVPISVWQPRPRLGKPIGGTGIEQAIFPQHDLNRLMSQRANNREIMANPFILVDTNSIVDEEEWDNRPGGIRRYQGTMPKVEPGSGMPGIVVADEQSARQQIMQSFGLRDASQGRNPSGVRSARQIVALQEADETQFGPRRERRERFAAEVARLIIQTASQYVREPRMARILGDEDQFRVFEYSADLMTGGKNSPGVDYFDVRVKNSGVARTRAQTESLIMQLIQYQGIDMADPDMRSSVFETLQFGDPLRRLDSTYRDRSIQRRRNRLMMLGQYEQPETWENQDILLDELNSFRKGGAYRQARDEVKQLFSQYEIDLIAAKINRQAVLDAGVQRAMQLNPQLSVSGGAPGNVSSQPVE